MKHELESGERMMVGSFTSTLRAAGVLAACTLLGCLGAVAAGPIAKGDTRHPDKVRFNHDVRPILSENCFRCHGPDPGSRKAGLRFDREEGLFTEREGVTPVVRGKPDQSALYERIMSTDEEVVMPPPRSHKKLTADQKELLRKWIEQGASWEPHWSFVTPRRPPLPFSGDSKSPPWLRNGIDQFVLARLQAVGLQPAPEADRRTLARRLSLDLIGLPPAPAEVEAFVQDSSPDAYEKYVDRLLDSPHWGEHRGRYWLDAARYADTHGLHIDNYREMWAYRDWVINAFNKNVPFDRFTIEQLAGDLLPDRTTEQQIASGFHRCNITTNEGGAIPEEVDVMYQKDRVETTTTVWLGLTGGCASCHDHKFDPISQKEFYQFVAFFKNTTQSAMDGNIHDTPPILRVPRPEDRERWGVVTKALAEVRQQVEARKQSARPEFERWLAQTPADQITGQLPQEGLRVHALLNEGDGNVVKLNVDGQAREVTVAAGLAWEAGHVAAKAFKTKPGALVEIPDIGDIDKDQPFTVGAWVWVPKNSQGGAVVARMDDGNAFRGWDFWMEGDKVGAHFVHRWPDDAIKVLTQNPVTRGVWHHLLVTYDGSAKAAGFKVYVDGVPQPTAPQVDGLKNTTKTTVPFKFSQRHSTSRTDNLRIQDLRLYGRTLAREEVERLARGTRAAWLVAKEKRSPAEQEELFDGWLTRFDTGHQAFTKRFNDLQAEEAAIKARGSVTHVMQEKLDGKPLARLLFRGQYDQPRDQVDPAVPAALHPYPAGAPNNRLGLARWLMNPDNPLTARVTVNRSWQEVFGTGLVRTSEDFGIMGENPTHPELLDWLAVEFRESGWDMKRFFKLLVMSATYRQAALTTPEKLKKDPNNRLLSRGPRFRLDGELLRDHALAASGLLARKVGGPSVKPYQPPGVWEAVAMTGSNTRFYKPDGGEGLYRRSLYWFWKRSAPPASMEIFNAPSRENCSVRRERTNTPLQALVTLNDPQLVEAARHLAQRALQSASAEFQKRLDFITLHVVARPFEERERHVCQAALQDYLTYFQGKPQEAEKLIATGESKPDTKLPAVELAAWTMLVNQVMNLDEALNK